jgi:hypothetical protein
MTEDATFSFFLYFLMIKVGGSEELGRSIYFYISKPLGFSNDF